MKTLSNAWIEGLEKGLVIAKQWRGMGASFDRFIEDYENLVKKSVKDLKEIQEKE